MQSITGAMYRPLPQFPTSHSPASGGDTPANPGSLGAVPDPESQASADLHLAGLHIEMQIAELTAMQLRIDIERAQAASTDTCIEMAEVQHSAPTVARGPAGCDIAGWVLLATHLASFVGHTACSIAPFVAPAYFRRRAMEAAFMTTALPPTAGYAATVLDGVPDRVPRTKTLTFEHAIFSPLTMVSPYFALLALGDLICWAVELKKPGVLPFQGDSVANVVAWMNNRGAFGQLQAALGPLEKAGGDNERAGMLVNVLNKLRDSLALHDDPNWQKQLAWKIRLASAGLLILLISRLEFACDDPTIPKGLAEFYDWLEGLSAGVMAVAGASEVAFDAYHAAYFSPDALESVVVELRDAATDGKKPR